MGVDKILYVSTTRHQEWSGPKRYIRIHIYESLDEIQKIAGVLPEWEDWREVHGIFIPSAKGVKPFAGTIVLWSNALHTEILTHESVHAACHIYRCDVSQVINLGNGVAVKGHQNEEKLAYIIGDVTSGVMNAIYDWVGWPS